VGSGATWLKTYLVKWEMDSEQRADAIFGAFDGVVSVAGVLFALLVHGSPDATIAIAGIGGAIANSISMGSGDYEQSEGTTSRRLKRAVAMAVASLIGSLVPVWGFFFLGRSAALVAGAVGSLAVAVWIGYEKRKGARGYVEAFGILLAAVGITLAIVSFLPASA
jgi:VIT1/CCC1 family predicted Fe2+/Mn2+ transporter